VTLPRPGATCEIAGCDRPAAGACDNCGHLCCAAHLAPLTLVRRIVAPNGAHREPLARLPVSTETYMLCPRCGKRPFAGKPSSSSSSRRP
jgi:hypothetical protein